MKTITDIVKTTPRASVTRPYIQEQEDGTTLIKAGSPADACRIIEGLRQAGYFARMDDARDARTVRAASLSCLI